MSRSTDFSNSAYYVFHTASRGAFFEPAGDATRHYLRLLTRRRRSAAGSASGNANFVSGNASLPAGNQQRRRQDQGLCRRGARITSSFNLDGLSTRVRKVVKARQAATPITLDAKRAARWRRASNANGPDPGSDGSGGAPSWRRLPAERAGSATGLFFKNLNTAGRSSLEVDKGAPYCRRKPYSGVWGGTHKKM